MIARSIARHVPPRPSILRDAELLARLPNETFDGLAHLAVRSLRASVAVLTAMDDSHQLVLGGEGLAPNRARPLAAVLTTDIVDSWGVLRIADVRREGWLRCGSLVRELEMRACVGVSIRCGGRVRGHLCVLDRDPRDWRPEELQLLREIATMAGAQLDQRVELRRARLDARRQRERADSLLSTTDRFRSLVERSLAGIYLIQDGRFGYVNPRMAEIFGYTQPEMEELPVMAVVAEEDRERVEENLRRRVEGEVESIHYELRGVRKDGEPVEVEVHGSRAEVDGRPAVIGTLVDVTERRRAERALTRREEHLRALLDNSWDAVHVVDATGAIRYINPAIERVLGYAPQEMLGRSAHSFVHPDEQARAGGAFEAALAHPGERVRMELRLRGRDGEYRTVEAAAVSATTDGGDRVVIVNTHDVTEQRRIEATLRESEERYRLVIRASESAVWDWDVGTGQVIWDGESTRMLRYAASQIERSIDWWYSRLHPDDRERVVSSLQDALEDTAELWSEEYRFGRRDGSYATVLNCCAILRDEAGAAVRVVGSMRDVTERRRSEDGQRFLARASAVLDESLDHEVTLSRLTTLVVPTLADGCVIDVVGEDGVTERVASASADAGGEFAAALECRDDPDAECDHPIGRVIRSAQPVLLPLCTDAALGRIGYDAEDRERLRALQLRSLMIVPLLVHHRVLGAITFVTGQAGRGYGPVDLHMAEDLARRVATVIEHSWLYQAAQDAVRVRDEITAMVSHDLRNPISTIQISAGLVLDQAEDRRAANLKPIQIIQRAAEQMGRLVEDLLDVSRIEAGRFAVEQVDHEVGQLFAEASTVLQPLASARGLTLQWQAADRLPRLRIDPHQILRVLSNLVGNAVKFTPQGGTIRVDAAREGDEIWFSVRDSGPGIPLEQLSHVFDRYWKARSGDRRGAGLGLAISKGIVEAHGGRIWAERPPEGGARFVFTVPIEAPAEARALPQPARPRGG